MHTHRNKWRFLTLSATLLPLPLMGQFNADLTGYWPLDSDLTDASGNHGDGSFQTTGVLVTPTFGGSGVSAKFGDGIVLDSTSQEHVLIDGAGNPSFPGEDAYDSTGGSVSVSLWATNTAFTSNWQALTGKGEGSSWRLSRLGESNTAAYAGGFGDISAEGSSDVSGGLHHYVAVTDANRGIYLYVDGVLEGHVSGTPVITDSTFNMAIGANPQSAGRAWNGTIDDVIFFTRPLTGPEVSTIYHGGIGVSGADIIASADSDSDGVPDFYETANGMTVGIDDSAGDLDNDDLTNIEEYNNGLGANNPDADNDGLEDGDEFDNNGDPFVPDTDNDGLSDGDEVNLHGTLVDNSDSDNDGASDFEEIKAGTDPLDPNSFPSSWSIGLTGYWSFNDSLEDTSGNEADGTFVSTIPAATPTYSAGQFGNAISLNEINDEYVEISSVPEQTFDFTAESMSASVWCSTAAFTTGWQAIMAKGEGTSWRVARAATTDEASFNPGDWKAGGDDLRGGNIGDGAFHHVVVITDKDGTGQLWVDGLKVAETTAPPVIGNTAFNLFIGANPGAPAEEGYRSWNGSLDDVAIWNRALSPAEINQLYSSGISLEELILDGDNDFDGLPNSWESANGTQINVPDADEDPDNDNRTNIQEFNDGTDPQDPDADADDLNDGEEFAAGTNPLIADTDADGLSDGDEVKIHSSNPLERDSDADGSSDSVEIEFGTLPNDNTSFPSLEQGLMGYWAFDEDLKDGTGNGGNGTYIDLLAGTPEFVPGKFGNSINFVETNKQYVVIDGEGGLTTPPDYTQAGGNITISAWTSVSTFVGNWQGLVARGEGTAWRVAGRGPNGDNTGQFAFAGGTGDLVSPDNYDDEVFHHIAAVTEDGFNARLYIDGALVATSGTPPTLSDNGNANFIAIGSNPDALDRTWNGAVDDVAIWARPLSDGEILALATATDSLGDQLGLGGDSTVTVTDITVNDDGSADLTWTSRDGASYSIFMTTDLSLPAENWDPARTGVTGGGTTTTARIPANVLTGLTKVFFTVSEE